MLLIDVVKDLVCPEFFHAPGYEELLHLCFGHIEYIGHITLLFSCGR